MGNQTQPSFQGPTQPLAIGQLHRHSDWVLSTFLLFSEAGERVLQGRVETHNQIYTPVGLRPAHCTPILFSTLIFN